jgi:hypothetical protein
MPASARPPATTSTCATACRTHVRPVRRHLEHHLHRLLEQRNDNAATTPVEQRPLGGDFRVRSTFNLDWQYGDFGIG